MEKKIRKKRSKKNKQTLTEQRIAKWEALRKEPQESIDHEIFLVLLNAIFMGKKRNQDVAKAFLMVEKGLRPQSAPPIILLNAFDRAKSFLETAGYFLDAGYEEPGSEEGCTSFIAIVRGIQKVDPKPIRKMYWEGRKLKKARAKVLVIPRLRKKNVH